MEATLYMILMGSEIVDKLVDYLTANDYMDGNITNNPKESVSNILMGIFCLGLLMTVFRIFCHIHKIKLSERGDNSKDKVHHAINVLTSWAKMLFEDFPQATIAMCFFGNCAPKSSTQTTVQAFNAFSIFSFAMFTVYVVTYFHNYVEMADRVMAYSITLFLQFLICLIGFIFAIISTNSTNHAFSLISKHVLLLFKDQHAFHSL